MRWILSLVLVWLGTAATATVTLPDALSKRIKRDPAAYLDEVAALIAGHGAAGAIDADGLDDVVLLARASARARALARVLTADLDGDGAVTAAEVAVVSAAAAAEDRGKLAVLFVRADSDGDGVISGTEAAAFAGAAGMAAYGDVKAGQLRAVMAFDRNGDGRVTLDEVRAGLTELGLA
ncbi:MAG: EF-hand domain-containing protein [bacterium]